MTEIPSEAYDYVAAGETLHAVRVVRDTTGLGLRESKEIVDRIARGDLAREPSSPRTDATVTEADLVGEIAPLVRDGRTLEAIKHVRERTGLDLRDSKAIVDRVEAGVPPGASDPRALAAQVLELVDDGREIEAIRHVRDATGVGLREAKEAVDRVRRDAGVPPSRRPAAAVVAVAFLILLVAVWVLVSNV